MTQDPENTGLEAPALSEAGKRLDAALARLEAGLGALAAKAARPAGERAGDGGEAARAKARAAQLELALQEASGTVGALIAEVRSAIQAAETEAAKDAGEAPHGQG